MQSYSRIFIRDLKLNMSIGISAEEQSVPQPVVVNVQADVNWPTDLGDDYNKVVCYAGICKWIRARAQTPVALVETLAEDIAAHVLSIPQVSRACVQVEKPAILPDAVVGVDICRVK